MKWPAILDIVERPSHRYATVEDVRKIFVDYHDALHWLAGFLVGDTLAPACVIDACNIAERQGPVFHEWLAHWAARATLRCALQMQGANIGEIAPTYERFESVHAKRSPLSPASASYRRIGRSAGSTRRPLSLRARHARHCQGILRGSCRAARGQPERRRASILRCI